MDCLIKILSHIIEADPDLKIFIEPFSGFKGSFQLTKHCRAYFKGQYETVINGDFDKNNMLFGIEEEALKDILKNLGKEEKPILTIAGIKYPIQAIKTKWSGLEYDGMIKLKD